MIDRHYGHLARDGHEHAIKLLDALNAPWTLVDTVLACLRRFRSRSVCYRLPPLNLAVRESG